jgi:pyruvate carboxylase
MKTALGTFRIEGIKTNINFLRFVIEQPEFVAGKISTNWLENTVLPKFLASLN